MKKLILACALGLSLSANTQAEYTGYDCQYDAINGQEYIISDASKRYVTNNFYKYADRKDYQQERSNDRVYDSLRQYPFKIVETGLVTKSTEGYGGFLGEFRYTDFTHNGEAYTVDKLYNTEVITSDCQTFYYQSGDTLTSFTYATRRIDGSDVTMSDFKNFLGEALVKKQVDASTVYDKFERAYNIRTEKFDDYFIDGWYGRDSKKLTSVKIFTQISNERAGYRYTAKDTNGNTHKVEVLQVDLNYLEVAGLFLHKEMIAIDVNEEFLKKNRAGFDLKVSDGLANNRIIKISGDVVQAFLDELQAVKMGRY